jgi:hypothetical protein
MIRKRVLVNLANVDGELCSRVAEVTAIRY